MDRVAETGVVVACDGNTAWVKTIQRSSCATCQARHGCGQSSLQAWFERSDVIAVSIVDDAPTVGESVSLSVASNALAKASMLVYLVPLLGLLAGLFLANAVSGREGLAVLGAGLGFAVGCVAVRYFSEALKNNIDYVPRLERRLGDYPNENPR